VAVRLPPFWAERPAVWFAQAEAQFFLACISSETTKFYHVVSQLDQRYATELEDVITSPPERDPYTTLRAELLGGCPPRESNLSISSSLSRWATASRPSSLRHLRSLAPGVPEDFLHTVWSSRLPPNIQAILAGQHEGNLDAAARTASPRLHPSQRSLALVHQLTAPYFCGGSRTSPTRWQHSAPSRTAFAPAPGTLTSAPGTLTSAPGTLVPAPEIPPRL
jgi:hypothetical protein